MTEQECLECDDPIRMLRFLGPALGERKLLLFTLACAARNMSGVNKDGRRIYGAWTRYVEGLTSFDEVSATYEQAGHGGTHPAPNPYDLALWDAEVFASQAADRGAEVHAQVITLRDLLGPLPFRQVKAIRPWPNPTARRLAALVSADQDYDSLPIVADALEEAGCDDADILSHLRGAGPHFRGCWAVDLMTGSQ